jgi:hypothetical protein
MEAMAAPGRTENHCSFGYVTTPGKPQMEPDAVERMGIMHSSLVAPTVRLQQA